MSWCIARMQEGRSAFNMLICKPKGKRYLGRPRRCWEDSIITYFKETDVNPRNWIDSAEDRDRNYWY